MSSILLFTLFSNVDLIYKATKQKIHSTATVIAHVVKSFDEMRCDGGTPPLLRPIIFSSCQGNNKWRTSGTMNPKSLSTW